MFNKLNQCIIMIFLLSIFMLEAHGLPVQKPLMIFYFVDDCENCQRVKKDFLPKFLEKYSKHFTFVELNAANPVYLDSLYAMESRAAVPEEDKDFPAVYFMGSMIEGEIPIRLKLNYLVENYIANPDSMKAVDSEVMSRIPEIAQPDESNSSHEIFIAFFSEQGCKECSRTEKLISWLKSKYPFLKVDEFDIAEKRNKLLAAVLGDKRGVPDERLMSTPLLFIGNDYLLAEDISLKNLESLVKKYEKSGSGAFWHNINEDELNSAEENIRDLFKSFTIWGIAFAGLVDGINPCAFATILFFVAYLGMIGRKKNEILMVGLSFAFAVFVTYFLIGIGLLKIIEQISYIEVLSKIIFGGTAGLCIIFGFLSINDYFKVRAGKTSDMTLQLPAFLKRRIHKTIRKKTRMKSYVAGALITGFLVSILELACTGQVYLPTIMLMVRNAGTSTLAKFYLILYNGCFIIPLLIVFGVVYFGVSSHSIAKVMESRVGLIKLLLALVFFGVAGLLIWMVFL